MINEPFQCLLRELARSHQTFELLAGRQIRAMGLTPAQYDVLVCLGTSGNMNCGDLGEKTLITKGTLTGVLDRMEAKGLIRREESREDRRSILVDLTESGRNAYLTAATQHTEFLRPAFSTMNTSTIESLTSHLVKLRETLQQYNN